MKWAQYKIELPFKLEPTFFNLMSMKTNIRCWKVRHGGLVKGFDLNSLQGGARRDETKTAACEAII